MISTTLFPGRYVQGTDSIERLGLELSRFGQKVFAICTPSVLNKMLPILENDIKKFISVNVEKFNKECSDEEIDRLSFIAKKNKSEVIVGIGGGKTIDTAKAVAYKLTLPVAIVPTIASSDAPCSALSVIYTQTGEFKRYLILPKNPDLVLVDTKIIVQAPVRFLVSGMGDALATWFEAESCKIKYAGNMTGDIGSITAIALAKLCYKTLIEYGYSAKLACEAHVITPALEHIVEANTLLSGLGFESGGLATAHAIHNGLTVLEQTHKYFHGEKVAIGTLASLFLTDKPMDVINKAFSFCETVGLPTTLEDIGLSDISDSALMKVAELTCAEGETIYNESIPVTPEMVFSALKTTDSFGKSRKIENKKK
ncbi:MAG: glycerol dehydrogenase [Desulfobacteraceae bacterium 4572_130]|nr:MAG: glycerol dehydrogenase [Desulfobacteraceae bacterium 4572_130]